MALPITLSAGMVSIYGAYSPNNIYNAAKTNTLLFGVVYSTSGQPGYLSVGDFVCYKPEDVYAIINYQTTDYTIINEGLVKIIQDPYIPT